jgi:glycine cleavage system protein P-like pyridoxal-binding family
VLSHIRSLGAYTPNTLGTPVIELPLAEGEDIDEVGKLLWDRGIYVTLAAYPLVPRDQVGFRAQVTAANTDEEIDLLVAALEELAQRGQASDVDTIEREIRARDHADSTRAESPLTRAPDAVHLDTTELGLEEVVRRMLSAIDKLRQAADR